MTTTFGSRSILLALGLGLALASACFDESVLENQDCAEPADCAKNQDCVQTAYQATLPDPFGWCRPEGERCAEGSQPGCDCEADGVNLCCRGTEVDMLAPYLDQDGSCRCYFAADTSYFPTLPESAGGCIVPSG